MTPSNCAECPMRDVNCDKMVLAWHPIAVMPIRYGSDLMTCREANHNGYNYMLISERSLDERSEEMLKAGRKPETDGTRKRKDQVEEM